MPIFFPTTITGKPAAGGGPKVVTYQTQTSGTTSTNYTFSSQAIGTATSDRIVIVAVHLLNTGATGSSMTVGGISATRQVRSQRGTGTSEIWTAAVPTGTTATIVVNGSAASDRCGIIVWTATGLLSGTAVGTGTNTSSSSPHATAAFATSNGGFVIMTSCDNGSPTYTESVSGGGTPAITEDYDGIFGGSPTMVGARTAATDGTNITVTITGGTSANGGMCAASF